MNHTVEFYIHCHRWADTKDTDYPLRDVYYGPFSSREALDYLALVKSRGCSHQHAITDVLPSGFYPVGVTWPPS